MKATVWRAAGLLVGLGSAWSSLLTAQVGASALANLQAHPQVTVSAVQHNHSVAASLDIRVRVTNLTEATMILDRVEVLMPAEFLAGRRDKNPDAQVPPSASAKLLPPGAGCTFLFTIQGRRLPWLTQWMNPQLLAFVPGEYETVIRTHFQVPPLTESEDEILKVSFEPPLGILIWGGVAGAALLAGFVGTYRYFRQTPKVTLRTAILQVLAVAAGGAVSAAIALILMNRLKGLELPLNITVKDFYGGIVVGLFSYKLGDWLYAQLFGSTSETASGSSS